MALLALDVCVSILRYEAVHTTHLLHFASVQGIRKVVNEKDT